MLSRQSAVAAAVWVLVGAANAVPNPSQIVRSSSSSSSFLSYQAALQALCVDAGGVATVFTSGHSIATIVCANTTVTAGAGGTYLTKAATDFRNFARTAVAEVRINVAGGSYTAVQALGTAFAGDTYFNPWTNSTGTETGSIGGFHDVDLTGFTAEVLSSAGTLKSGVVLDQPVGVALVFGVAASARLYEAMFTKQKADGLLIRPDGRTCNLSDTGIPTCVPSISKADMAAIMDSNEFDDFSLRGAEPLGAPAGTELRYARRVDTAGAQAAAQAYFLHLPCAGANARSVIFDPADTLGAIGQTFDDEPGELKDYLTEGGLLRVTSSPSTGHLLGYPHTELSSNTNYVIGVLSAENTENNQTGQRWKWLRVSEVPMADDAKPRYRQLNRATVLSGRYDFYEELAYSRVGTTLAENFFTAVTGKLQTLTPPTGLVKMDGVTMTYSKNGKACTPSVKL